MTGCTWDQGHSSLSRRMMEGSGRGLTRGGASSGAAGGEVVVPSSRSQHPIASRAGQGLSQGCRSVRVSLVGWESSKAAVTHRFGEPHAPAWGGGSGLQSPTASGGVAPAGSTAGDLRAQQGSGKSSPRAVVMGPKLL